MNTELMDIGKNKFLRIPVMPISQKNKNFYLAKMSARSLINVYTVEPAEYNVEKEAARAATFPEYAEYIGERLKEKRDLVVSKKYERLEKKERVEEIAEFLNKDEYALFPNTIIVTCELINTSLDYEPGREADVFKLLGETATPLSFLEEPKEPGEQTFLYVPYMKKSILIIDGQHRLRGLEEADPAVTDNYEILVSFIVGFSWSVVAKLFYTINYTQKAVNKSLLYHLTGEFSPELDEITFMHETVRALNEVSQSPLFKRIKMLGTVDYSLPPEDRKKMTISQAFLIDYLHNTISIGAINRIYPPIFLYYYQRREKWRVEIVRFLMKYFEAIRESRRNDWDNPTESIICNTLGVGAFIRILHFLFVKMFITDFDKNPSMITEVTVPYLVSKLKGIDKVDFSKSGEYGRVASGGSLNKLRGELVEKIIYFGKPTFDDFIEEYRQAYLGEYKQWLKANLK
jgi:DGQHR domain-containing protein